MPPDARPQRPPDEIRFGGPGDPSAAAAEEPPDPNRGATLEQTWNLSSQLFGIPHVCLLAVGGPRIATARIPRVVQLDPNQLVASLSRLLAEGPHTSSQAFTYD